MLRSFEVGCFEGQGAPSGEADSTEGYASGIVEAMFVRLARGGTPMACPSGKVAWRKSGTVTFPDATDASVELRGMRFGVQAAL